MRANDIMRHFTKLTVVAGLVALGSPAVYAGPGEGTLYGTDGANFNLVTIDPTDALNITSTSTGVDLQALAANPADDVIFAGSSVGDVYTVTPAGSATMLGAAGAGVGAMAITGMDFDSSVPPVLFAALDMNGDGGGDTLATIDTTTGAAITTSPLLLDGFPVDGFQAIAFHPDGPLYGTSVGVFGSTTLYTINPADASLELVDDIATLLDGGISGLQFDCDGILYAGTALDPFFGTDGGNLGIVGPLDGTPVYTEIDGPSTATGGDVAALAFADSCDNGGGGRPLEVVVDLEAGPDATPIRCNQSNRALVTAVLSSDGSVTPAFDATTIDADTVRFGRHESATLTSEKHQKKGHATRHEQDVNGDGLTDLVFHFRLGDTDFSCADIPGGESSALIPAAISGQLAGGEEFEGSSEFEMRN